MFVAEKVLLLLAISLTDHKMWDGTTYPFLNFSDETDEVWKCISDFIPHFTGHLITYPGLKLIRPSKRGPWIWLRWQLNQAQQNWAEIERKFSIHAFHSNGHNRHNAIVVILQCPPKQVLWEISIILSAVRMYSFQLLERHGDFLMGTIVGYTFCIMLSNPETPKWHFLDSLLIMVLISMEFVCADPFEINEALAQCMAWTILIHWITGL